MDAMLLRSIVIFEQALFQHCHQYVILLSDYIIHQDLSYLSLNICSNMLAKTRAPAQACPSLYTPRGMAEPGQTQALFGLEPSLAHHYFPAISLSSSSPFCP